MQQPKIKLKQYLYSAPEYRSIREELKLLDIAHSKHEIPYTETNKILIALMDARKEEK